MRSRMGADELADKAKGLRDQQRYSEAVVVAREATREDPDHPNAWWQLGLAIKGHQGVKKALEAFTKTTELAPSFGPGWLQLGLAEEASGLIEDAKISLRAAFENDSDLTTALDKLAELSFQTKDVDEEFWALERLAEVGDLSGGQCNRLGILHHDKGELSQAITYYRRATAELADPAGWINLGLVYTSEEVNQRADAVDILREGKLLYPEKERLKTMLDSLLPAMLAMAGKVRARSTPLLSVDEQFLHYINPFELINVSANEILDLDAKGVQRAKRRLLNEIELEDGRVGWIPGMRIDQSRALSILGEIAQENDAYRYHTFVREDSRLLAFLSRGALDHFLVLADDKERVTQLALADADDDFASWLSSIFAAQFNLVLARAISQQDLDAVECLLSGRRWVLPRDEDACFVLTRRIVARGIDELDKLRSRVEKEKLSPQLVLQALLQGHLGVLLKILPGSFADERSRVFYLLRGIAVDTHNLHDDPATALEVLMHAEPLARKSKELKHKLETDRKKLKELKEEQDKHACRLTWNGKPLEITHAGARYGDIVIPTDQVASLRWGGTTYHDGLVTKARYVLGISTGTGKVILADWTTSESQAQEDNFTKLTLAALVYLMDSCITNVKNRLSRGETMQFGTGAATNAGLTVKVSGWLFTKNHTIPWKDLLSVMKSGVVTLFDRNNHKASLSLPILSTENAVTLHWIAKQNEE